MTAFIVAGAMFPGHPLAVPPLLTSLAILLLGTSTLVRERASRVSMAFWAMTVTAAVWLACEAGAIGAPDDAVAWAWVKAMYLGVPFIPPAVYLFTTVVLGTYARRARRVGLCWLVGGAFCVAILGTDGLFAELYHYAWGYFPHFRWLGGPYVLFFLCTFAASFREFLVAERASAPGSTYRRRARAFRFAFAVGYVGLVDFLPSFGVPLYPIGFLAVLGFVGLAARAVVRYRLVDITPALAAPQILQAMTDALLVIDPEGTIRVANRAAGVLLGKVETALVGRATAEVVDDLPLRQALDRLRWAARTQTVEIAYRTEGEGRRTLSLSGAPQRDPADRLVALVVVIRDLSERVRQEEQLREAYETLAHAQAQLVRQERLAALGAMASGIAHNFSNALTPIVGYSEVLLGSPDLQRDPALLDNWLRVINQAAHDAAHTLARLREFYRPAEEGPEEASADLNAVIANAVELTRPRWFDQALQDGRVIEVRAELGPVAPVPVDPAELREVLTNLIFNAVDALTGDGTITLRSRTEGRWVVVEVADTGAGMSEEVRRQCFEPFFTTKGPRGTGLGLSTVYGILRRHHGSVDVASAPGRGTTITLTLPVARPGPAEADAPPATLDRLRILVIDDDARVRDVVRCHLEADGHRVEEASDGPDGLARFGTEPFDLVIVDRSEPGEGGDRVAAEVKTRSPATAVLMLTGYGELMAAADERPPGVDLVLGKPVTRDELRGALGRLGAGRQQLAFEPADDPSATKGGPDDQEGTRRRRQRPRPTPGPVDARHPELQLSGGRRRE